MKVPPGAIPDQYETVMIYEKEGVKKEFTMQNYPWQDTTWKFVDRKDKLVKKGNAEPEIHDFALTDFDGNNHTEEILTTLGYTFLLFVKDPETASTENIDKLNALVLQARQWNIPLYIISSASKDITDKFLTANKIEHSDVLQIDNTASKTALRSNPGLMLLEQGTIRDKWSYKDYPQNIFDENGKLKTQK
jgi:methylglyoxal synthase